MKNALFIALGVVIVAAVGLAFVMRSPHVEPEMVGCTMEAKICPDGTAVGRVGPSCEFAPCPTISTEDDEPRTPPIGDGPEFDTGIGDASELSADGKACVAQGGSWDPQFKECVGIREGQCQAIGGEYDECASACRNQPSDTEVCTLQCVEVCTLN